MRPLMLFLLFLVASPLFADSAGVLKWTGDASLVYDFGEVNVSQPTSAIFHIADDANGISNDFWYLGPYPFYTFDYGIERSFAVTTAGYFLISSTAYAQVIGESVQQITGIGVPQIVQFTVNNGLTPDLSGYGIANPPADLVNGPYPLGTSASANSSEVMFQPLGTYDLMENTNLLASSAGMNLVRWNYSTDIVGTEVPEPRYAAIVVGVLVAGLMLRRAKGNQEKPNA